LKDLQCHGVLSVEGFLSEDIVSVKEVEYIPNTLFCIHAQRQYSAARNLLQFLQKYNMDETSIKEEDALRYFETLKVKC
jgi:hypothetical protein